MGGGPLCLTRGIPSLRREHRYIPTYTRPWKSGSQDFVRSSRFATFMDTMSDALQGFANGSRRTSPASEDDFQVDANILAKFPDGTTVISASSFGTSEWTLTARLHLRFPTGSDGVFFLKSAPWDHGRTLMEGEFNAMSELYKWAPDLVPKPHSWGKYDSEEPAIYFFISEFIDMKMGMPDPKELCKKLSRLHCNSRSPNGQFGFHITTCQGRVPQAVSWEENWTLFFTKLLRHVISLDFQQNGPWEGLAKVEQRLISHVIPRLLDALVEGDRTIKPCLIHGDLWEGNSSTDLKNGNIYIFDSAALYAHNEMEIGDWRCYYNNISSRVYTETYLQMFDPSEPKDEWDDRNRLYSIYYNVIYSVNHLSQGRPVRQL